jgi:hypothetical protein
MQDPATLAVLLAVAGSGALFVAHRAWRRARLVEDTPTSLARSAAQGFVRLEGTAQPMPGEPVIAPLSRRPCVWWRYRIEERRGSGNRWQRLEADTSSAHFELADATGVVLVDPDGAELHGTASDTWFGDAPQPQAGPPSLAGFRGLGDRYRYTEERVEAGAFVHALGRLTTERPGLGLGHDSEVAARLRAWKRDPAKRAEFDRDGNGELDLAEWEQARQAALVETVRNDASAPHRPTHVLRKPGHGQPFLLGAMAPETLALRQRRLAFGAGLLFLLCSAGAAWLVTHSQ